MRSLPTFLMIACAAMAMAACGGDSKKDIAPIAPTSVDLVAEGGFEGPMDAVVSPDGETFYFTAYDSTNTIDTESKAAVFMVPSAGGTATILVGGTPLEDPSGMVISCDGATLFVSDLGSQSNEIEAADAPIYSIATTGGALSTFAASGVGEATGLAMSVDCETIYVAGYKPDGTPAVFTVPVSGGAATILKEGAPLESPSGVHVDENNIAWVMDHKNSAESGGVLWAIAPDGTTDEVISSLAISEPAGVSLVAGGRIAVIPTTDDNGAGQLITVDTVSGDMTIVETPEILEPAGIRTATNASIMAVVDTDGNAIYRAQ